MEKQEIGEARNQFALDLQKELEGIRDKYHKEPSYYVLVYANVDNYNEVKTTIMRLRIKPPKLIGTMLYFVDNLRGTIERLWCLPLDTPKMEGMLDLNDMIDEVAKSSVDMPIIYH